MKKRILTAMLSVVMAFSAVPMQSVAAEITEAAEVTEATDAEYDYDDGKTHAYLENLPAGLFGAGNDYDEQDTEASFNIVFDGSENDIAADDLMAPTAKAPKFHKITNYAGIQKVVFDKKTVKGTKLTLKAGDKAYRINAKYVQTDNRVFTSTMDVISSNPSVVSVEKTGDGFADIKPLKAGTAYVSFTMSNKTKSVKVTVNEPAKELKVPDDSVILSVGKKYKPSVRVAAPTNDTFIWKSNDPKICKVDKYGVVTGKKEGFATVTVSSKMDPKQQKTIKVWVTPKNKTKKKIDKVTIVYTGESNLYVGSMGYITAGIQTKSDGVGFTSADIKFKSEGTGKVKIDKAGHLTAMKPGQVSITAWSGGKQLPGEIKLNISQPLKTVAMAKCLYRCDTGKTVTLKLKINPSAKDDANRYEVSWNAPDFEIVSSSKTECKLKATTLNNNRFVTAYVKDKLTGNVHWTLCRVSY
ncbi:MAG: Ig-like domain-containing protein [Lachnospiraceae bacterium]|nr:Ig-like domain-containing protein [Lachnospiraceae bacterium]